MSDDFVNDRFLVDTNILVYAYDLDAGSKRTKASSFIEELWKNGARVLTTQVLAELFVTITRKVKQPISPAEARQIVQDYRDGWPVFPTTPDTVLQAIDGVKRHQLSFWDAMIWAAAVLNDVAVLCSEDMQHNQVIEGVRIFNPLLA